MAQNQAVLPPVLWSADNHALEWELMTCIEKTEYRKVLCGKKANEKTSGETKAAIYRSIAKEIMPDLHAINASKAGDRVKGKIESLFSIYKKHVMRLHKTGAGIGSNDLEEGNREYASCYVGADGPDISTTAEAKNIWQEIESGFPFFPRLHALLSARPNMRPPAVATGVGPEGRKTVFYQAPATRQPKEAEGVVPQLSDVNDVNPVGNVPVAFDAAPVVLSQNSYTSSSQLTRQIPTMPVRTADATNKENDSPLPALGRSPRVSGFRHPALANAVKKAESSIVRLPQKRSMEDRFVELQERNIAFTERRFAEDQARKRRKGILEERELLARNRQASRQDFDDGIITKEEYKESVDEFRRRDRMLADEVEAIVALDGAL